MDACVSASRHFHSGPPLHRINLAQVVIEVHCARDASEETQHDSSSAFLQ